MHVISQKRLRDFWARHADAEGPLRAWHTVMTRGTFKDPHELKEAFPGADLVGDERAVFNIGGNRYRLVADLRYEWGRVYVAAVLTHAEYDRVVVREL